MASSIDPLNPLNPLNSIDPLNPIDPLTLTKITSYDNSNSIIYPIIPLLYNVDTSFDLIWHIVLIFNEVETYPQLVAACNQNTLPIVYNVYSSSQQLLDIFDLCTNCKRVGIIFHDSQLSYPVLFIDNNPFFTIPDLYEGTISSSYSANLQFIIDLINTRNLNHLDYLACNTLNYPNWRQYYNIIYNATGVTVGASSNPTGDIRYGADWILESTEEDIKLIYFTDSIDNYTDTLITGTISVNTLITAADVASGLVYTWPVTVIGGTNLSTIVTITFGSGIVFNLVGQYFICNGSYIIFDGCNNNITISGVTGWQGLIRNGTSAAVGVASNVTIKNIHTSATSTTLSANSAYIVQAYFGNQITSGNFRITDCSNTGPINGSDGGGIVGGWCGNSIVDTSMTILNCTNSGTISNGSGVIANDFGNSALSSTLTVSNCLNSANMASGNCAGIFGTYCCSLIVSSICNISGCINNCSLTGGNLVAGIGRFVGQSMVSSTINILNCTNSCNINSNEAGGIVGYKSGFRMSASTIKISGCSNTGPINGFTAGGIAGNVCGGEMTNASTINIIDCSNTGLINAGQGGGIVGFGCGQAMRASSTVNIANCSNTGDININATYAGGIVGANFLNSANNTIITGFCVGTISGCYNTGTINATGSGGIVGINLGSGMILSSITISKCYNIGTVAGTYAGGITGSRCGDYNYSSTIVLLNCYNTGNITGYRAGGITGADAARCSGSAYTNLTLTNCYSNGSIATTCGGILGGKELTYSPTTPTVILNNCYSSGTIVDTSSGIIALSLSIRNIVVQNNCYAANGAWNDASFVDLVGNYTMITAGTPRLLSAFNQQIYSPNTMPIDSSGIYQSTAGLFQPGYQYIIIGSINPAIVINSTTGVITFTDVSNVYVQATVKVLATKGSSPKYYGYNINNFVGSGLPPVPPVIIDPNALCICPKSSKPVDNGNVAFYNGSLNNPGNMVTQAMLFATRATATVAPSNWTTKIYQVTPRVIAPLANTFIGTPNYATSN